MHPNSSRRGSVLVEYIMLNLLILLPLVGFGLGGGSDVGRPVFNAVNDQRESLGFFGDELARWYQRVVDGICLPIP